MEANSKLTKLIEQINNGDKSMAKVDLSNCNLTDFPDVLFELVDTLEFLNMGGNQLSSLPDQIVQFKKLRIMFFAQNKFQTFPAVLGQLPALYMISFKSNMVEFISEEALSPSVSWLILTDNKIQKLPKSIGKLTTLRKCMLAGNLLTYLPEEMANCADIELLRLSGNRLTELPEWVLQLPKLSWLAYSGNPFQCINSTSNKCKESLKLSANEEVDTSSKKILSNLIDWNDITVHEQIGEGASGNVYKGIWKKRSAVKQTASIFRLVKSLKDQEAQHTDVSVALKMFKGDMTSDGLPEYEMDVSCRW